MGIKVDTMSVFKKNCLDKTKYSLSEQEICNILCSLYRFRNLENIMNAVPQHLCNVLFNNTSYSKKMLFPIDTIELRKILETNKIKLNPNIILFSRHALERSVNQYSVFLIIDVSDIDLVNLGGISVYKNSSLNIKGKIKGIRVSRYANASEIFKIVDDVCPEIPVHVESDPEGIDKYKFAQASKKKFIVNLPSLGITGQAIGASSKYEALERALALRWDRHPDSKESAKPERYFADYWFYSPFFNSIVKESSSHKMVKTSEQSINLTNQEKAIFDTILAIDQQFNLGQQYRVAGGWVRDKILGKQSDDIDISLDKMTGKEFISYARKYAESNPDSGIGKHYVVEQNSDKSKHLETSALEIGGLKIDLVNLRAEDYASDSRVPEMRFGTPEEDASRRDLTINGLFYNINQNQIEDYVGGIEDLKSLTLRTPLDPKQTFLDDPLRMLRVLRFHSRYNGSSVDPSIISAMQDKDVQEAYSSKVSPERAGPEIMKLFYGETPEESIRILHETGLDSAVFNLPEFSKLNPMDMDQENQHHELNLLDHSLKVMKNYNDLLRSQNIDGKDRALALIASWFHDFGKRDPDIRQPSKSDPNSFSYHGHENVSSKLLNQFLKHIGIGKDDREFASVIADAHMMPHSHQGDWSKRQMGKLRQKTTIPGQDRDDIWKFVMWHAHADAAAKNDQSDIKDFPEYEDRFNATSEYMNQPPPIKPLLNGNDIMQMFPNLHPKTGFIARIHEMLTEKQIDGSVSSAEEAAAFVESIRSDIENEFDMNKKASGWYKSVKKADASSGSVRDSGFGPPQSSEEGELHRHDGEKRMIYYPDAENSRFQVGDKVKIRPRHSLSTPIQSGTIVSKKGAVIEVSWNGGGKEKFDLNDIETAIYIEKV